MQAARLETGSNPLKRRAESAGRCPKLPLHVRERTTESAHELRQQCDGMWWKWKAKSGYSRETRRIRLWRRTMFQPSAVRNRISR